MECNEIRDWLFRKIDGELSEKENEDLNAHLAQCVACAREFNLLALPQRIASTIPAFEPSAYFSRKLSASIATEAQNNSFWLAILNPARRIVPALACITLLFLSVFVYFQLSSPKTDLYKAYERVFISEDQANPMLIKGDIPDENIMRALYALDLNKGSELE